MARIRKVRNRVHGTADLFRGRLLIMDVLVDLARAEAFKAHMGQMYGHHPYSKHLEDVVNVLHEYEHDIAPLLDEETVVGGYLHDAVEDQGMLLEDVEYTYGDRIAGIVKFCTDCSGRNRKERKAATYKQVQFFVSLWRSDGAGFSWVPKAICVKVADRLANIRDCKLTGNNRKMRMYADEHTEFRIVMRQPGVCDRMFVDLDEEVASWVQGGYDRL